jgi:hypothetical protein
MVQSVVGEYVYIGDTVTKADIKLINNPETSSSTIKTTFEAQTPYDLVPDNTMRGAIGTNANIQEVKPIPTGVPIQYAGGKSFTQFSLELPYDSADALCQKIKSASKSRLPKAIKIVLADKEEGVGTTATTYYTAAIVSNFEISETQVDGYYNAKVSFALQTDWFEVARIAPE